MSQILRHLLPAFTFFGRLRSLASCCYGRGVRLRRGRALRALAARSCRTAPQPLLEPVPATDGIVGRSPPRFHGSVCRRLLFVSVAERHPIAGIRQHRVEILDARQVIAQLRLADLYHERRRRRVRIAIRLERTAPRRGRRLPWVARSSGACYIVDVHGVTVSSRR